MDKSQMECIYETYKNIVYRTAFTYCKNKADSEDITQEVFILRFKSDIAFNSPEHEKAWFIRVTVNKCKDLFKSFRFKYTVPLDDKEIIYTTPEESEVYHAVMELPKKYRIVIHLYYYEEYQIKDIAKILKKSETAIQTQLYRARNMLRNSLGKEFQYEY